MAKITEDRQKMISKANGLLQMTVLRGCTEHEAKASRNKLFEIIQKYEIASHELDEPIPWDYAVNAKPSKKSETARSPDPKVNEQSRYRSGRMWHPKGGRPIPVEEMADDHVISAYVLLTSRLKDPKYEPKWIAYRERVSWLKDEAKRRGLRLP